MIRKAGEAAGLHRTAIAGYEPENRKRRQNLIRLFRKQSERKGRTLLITESACFFFTAVFLSGSGGIRGCLPTGGDGGAEASGDVSLLLH